MTSKKTKKLWRRILSTIKIKTDCYPIKGNFQKMFREIAATSQSRNKRAFSKINATQKMKKLNCIK